LTVVEPASPRWLAGILEALLEPDCNIREVVLVEELLTAFRAVRRRAAEDPAVQNEPASREALRQGALCLAGL
jgi:hypothetical protein